MVQDKINIDNKLTSITSSDSMTSTEEFPSRSTSDSNSQAVEMETTVDEPQSISTSISTATPDSTSAPSNSAPSRKRFSVDAFKFNFRNRKNSQANQISSDKNKKEDKLVQESQQHTQIAASLSQPDSSVEHQTETQDGKIDGNQIETNSSAVGDEQKETSSKEVKESESAASEESPTIPNRSTSTSNKQRRTRSSSFSTSSSPSKQILAFKFPSFTSQKPSSSSKRSPYSNQNHSVSVPALVTSTSHGPSRQELARSSGLPIRRVSFSPSIDEALEAREEALAHLEQLRRESTEELIRDWDREDKKKSLKEEKERKKLERKEMKLKRRESGEGKKLKGSTSTSDKEVESDTKAINKDSQFTWDQDGIHSPKERRRRPSKAKVSKRQAIAARHARILEHVINGGTGLSSTEPIPSHPSSDQQQSSKKNKNKKNDGKNPTIPLATSQELNQLKKALMDANIANGIIGELRAMKLPVKASGLVEHQERVLVSDEKMVLKEDEKKVNRDTATTTEVPFDPFNRPQLHRSQSEAELALRKVGSRDVEAQAQMEDATTTTTAVETDSSSTNHNKKFHFGNFRRRTSSNASSKPESSHAIPIPLKACALSHSDSQAHHHHIHNGPDELKKFKQRHEDAIKNSHQEASKKELATVAAVGVGGIGLWNWWNSSSKKDSSTIPQEVIDGAPSQVSSTTPSIETQAKEVEVEEEEGIFSLNSLDLPQVPNLPYGVSPISLIMSPTSTAITASASASGAFDMMASVSGAAIRASGTDLNIQPPLDRMAIFVHWWGFEITIPKASMKFLSTAQSVSGAFMGFLSTMCVSGGVPELLPFVKYISMYMDVEFKAIQQQDKGNGVVVAATWFMPLALVPRPFDYPLEPPPVSTPTPAPAPSKPPTSQDQAGSIPTGILIPPTPATSLPILPMQALSTPSLSRTPSNGSTSSSLRSESPGRNGSSPPRTPTASQILAVANAQKEGISPLGNVEELMLEKGRKKNKTVALEILEELPEGSVRIKA